jgi:hypothetical protein
MGVLWHCSAEDPIVQAVALHALAEGTIGRGRRGDSASVLLMILFVFTVMHVLWRHRITLHTATWFAPKGEPIVRLSWAGWWYSDISIPIFQFILR